MKQMFLLILLVGAFIVGVGLLTENKDVFKVTQKQEEAYATVAGKRVDVEVADTDFERRQGLSKRESLGENVGLLFVFEEENITPSFWMKDMQFAIDIIWIDDGKVVQVDENIEPPSADTPDSSLKLFAPATPVDYALEVNAGFSERNGIEKGAEVNLSTAL